MKQATAHAASNETGIGVAEVIVGRQRRRCWTVEEKLRIVAETDEPGARIGDVAARYDLYPGLLFTWRRQTRKGTLTERRAPLFLLVEMASALDLPRPLEQSEPAAPRRIEIELDDGCRIRIDEGVGLASLRRVLTALPGVRIWLAAGVTDMRKGFDGLATLVQQQLGKDRDRGRSGGRSIGGVAFPVSPNMPSGTNSTDPEGPTAAAAAAFQAERQLYSRLSDTRCRRATSFTLPPSASTSAISAAFSSMVHFRRRSTRATISTSDTYASLWSYRRNFQLPQVSAIHGHAATRPTPGAYSVSSDGSCED